MCGQVGLISHKVVFVLCFILCDNSYTLWRCNRCWWTDIYNYSISRFELWLSSEFLVSDERRVKRRHYDHECSKKNECQMSARALKFMRAGALIQGNTVYSLFFQLMLLVIFLLK